MRQVRTPEPADVVAAAGLVGGHLGTTPVVRVPPSSEDRRGGRELVLKLETFQPTGSFKVRGALVAVARASSRNPGRPVVTASAGNHGLGVAFAANRMGVNATVVVPATCSSVKLASLRRFPARLVRHGETYDEAERHAQALADGGEASFISAYNDPDVIAGQGTIGIELLEQVPDVQTIIAPVGGGGLVAGLALAAAQTEGVRVLGVEAEQSQAFSAAVAAGRVVPIKIGATLADGLAGNIEPGSVTVELARRYQIDLLAVPEDEIGAAIRFLATEAGIIVEASAAVALAPVLSGRLPSGLGTTVVVLTGRNIAPATLAKLLGT